jgi:Rrf2 family protein
MLSITAEYALRAVLHLARTDGDSPVRVDSVAEALQVPRNYLSKVMHALAKSDILHSVRGPSGGFTLGRPASEITLADVIADFDPLEDRCLLMRRQCSDATPCIAHHQWKQVAVQVRSFFRNTTVEDLVRGATPPPGVENWVPPRG